MERESRSGGPVVSSTARQQCSYLFIWRAKELTVKSYLTFGIHTQPAIILFLFLFESGLADGRFFLTPLRAREEENKNDGAVGEGGEGVILSSQIDPQLMTDV